MKTMLTRGFASAYKISRKRKAAIMGCTGVVGQRFIQLLEDHPWFEIERLTASTKNAGKYMKDVNWKLATPLPERLKDKEILATTAASLTGCDVVFSALDSSIAGDAESELCHAGFAVFSNAKNHRMDSSVPLLIPPANADHINILKHRKSKGFIVTNANCASTGLAIALAPLYKRWGITQLSVFTMQAVSGAGYPGVASLDIFDNVVPYIGGEEEKMETELHKIFGQADELDPLIHSIAAKELTISAHCNRVPVLDGHTECVSVKLGTKGVTVEQVIKEMRDYQCATKALKLPLALPSAHPPLFVSDRHDRPQPRLDRDNGQGFTVTVGRVRSCPLLDVKFTLLSHNTVVGAAGGSIQNAELAVALDLC